MTGTRWFLGWCLCLGLAIACGGGQSSDSPNDDSPIPLPPVVEACDYACTCESGLTGSFDCSVHACSCSGCPSFAPPEPAPFQACGGDPTGFWQLSSYDPGPFQLAITNQGLATTCSGQFPTLADGQELLLELKADGAAAIHNVNPSADVEFASSCLSNAGARCSALPYDCKELACGLCHCTLPASSADVDQLTWSVSGNSIDLLGDRMSDQLPFCVAGDTLSYQPKGSKSVLTLERVYRTGEPQLCAERSAADCDGSCTLGQCVGTGTCSEGLTAATCAKYQNCAWDAQSCHGNVGYRCTVADYVAGLPGCVLSATAPQCVGTPLPCDTQPGCAAKGCLIGSACVGGDHDCFIDPGVEGCDCPSSSILCTGSFNCADVPQNHCADAGGTLKCQWSTKACVETPTACAELSLDECESTAGCVLQAP